jgi:hypothetical protein
LLKLSICTFCSCVSVLTVFFSAGSAGVGKFLAQAQSA